MDRGECVQLRRVLVDHRDHRLLGHLRPGFHARSGYSGEREKLAAIHWIPTPIRLRRRPRREFTLFQNRLGPWLENGVTHFFGRPA